MKWMPLILVMKNNFTLGIPLTHYMEFFTTMRKTLVIAERDAKNNYSTKSICGEQTRSSALNSTVDSSSLKKILLELLECKHLNMDDTRDVIEKADDDLMVMVAKTFTRFRARNNIFTGGNSSGSSSSKPFDMSQITCFKCGKRDHFMKECSSKSFSYTYSC